MIRDRHPPAPVGQLCVWLAAFCVGLAAMMMLAPSESELVPSAYVHTPDPNYLAERCSQRQGFILADNPACDLAPRTEDVNIYAELFEERD